MSKVSLYPIITELVHGQHVPFHELMEKIKVEWATPVEKLRTSIALGATEKEIAEEKAATLPYFTGSGIFSKRENNGLVQHSGKIIIDFDKLAKHGIDMQVAFDTLKRDKYTEYIFVSCSGSGLAVVVNIDPNRHLDSFLYLEKYYAERYPFLAKAFDKACKDVSRPRFVSYDPNLHSNTFFETVKLIDNSITVDSDEGRFEWAFKIHDKKNEYVEGNRHNYILTLCFWLNKCGVTEEYTLNEFLTRFTDKDPKEINRIVRDCYKLTHEFGTFVINKQVKDMPPEHANAIKAITAFAHGVNEAGREFDEQDITSMCNQYYLNADIVLGIFKNVFEKNKEFFGIDNKPEISKIEVFIKKKYEILRNVVTQRTEYRPAGSAQEFEILNSNTIFRKIQEAEFKFTFEKLKSLLRSDFVREYNPFVDYFNSLPDPDGIDHIDLLADHIVTDNQEFWKIQFKKALVRSIACTVGGRENRIVMTLVSPDQETGKSSFIRFLCPPALSEYYTEAPIDNAKDSEMQLAENFMQNLEELEVLQKFEVNRLKSIISRGSIKQRRAYAEFAEKHPRRVNFWASTNRTDFLTDDQNTRWLCFNVLSVNYDYNNTATGVKNIDINKVWAQAWQLYKSGFNYNLTKEEKVDRDKINKSFEMSSTEKNLVQTYFRPSTRGTGEFRTATDIMMVLIEVTDGKVTSKINANNIGKAMRQLGYKPYKEKIEGVPTAGYWCEKKYSQLGSTVQVTQQEIDYKEMDTKLF